MGLAPVDIFVNEESILRALSFVRHSAIPLEKKDRLRDLFLSYTGSADDTVRDSVKAKILEMIGAHPELSSLLPLSPTPAPTQTDDKIGTTRPTPTFATSAATPIPPKVEGAPAVEATVPEVEVPPAPEIPPPPVAPVPVPTPPSTPVAVAPAPISTNAKTRIDAIKRDINGKVGNPVNLIDQNETVGREYMAALLDAMKRSSKGDNDLVRLETAYQAALSVIGNISAATPTASKVEVVPAVEVTAPEVETPPAPEIPPPPVAPIPAPVPEPVPVKTAPIINTATKPGLYHRPIDELDEPEPVAEVKASPLPDLSSKLFKKIKVTPVADPAANIESDLGPLKLPTDDDNKTPAPKIVVAEKPAPPPTPPATPPADDRLRPLNEVGAALPEQISKIKAEAKIREEAANKPITDLKAPEVEQGLRQLLSEWSLFKGGGIFRRQPSGIDHPLYKQLAPLPMASVIAGRFEGMTPEIKHTLADYMTGWRYEQGVTHDMGETFERYLRRVVQVILEKQREAKSTPPKVNLK